MYVIKQSVFETGGCTIRYAYMIELNFFWVYAYMLVIIVVQPQLLQPMFMRVVVARKGLLIKNNHNN